VSGSRAILLVDHGSRSAEANALLEAVARGVRERLPGRRVAVAHLDLAAPSVAEAVDGLVAAGAREIVLLPYFLAPGQHGVRDIPALAERCAAAHPGVRVRVAAPLGLHPGLVDAVLDRVREAEG
jgi:sirohydrochlorin ferrochelatase